MRAREVMNRDGGKGAGRREGGRKRVGGDVQEERTGRGGVLTHRLKILFAEKVG